MQDWSQLRFIGGGIDQCQAFTDGRTVYRAVPTTNGPWAHINSFLKSHTYDKLVREGLIIGYERTDINPATFPTINSQREHRIIYQTEFLPFGLYPLKYGQIWTRAHHIEHVRTVARINQILQSDKLICQEAPTGNFIFNGSTPILVDIGAIGKRTAENLNHCKTSLSEATAGSDFNIPNIQFNRPTVWQDILARCDKLPKKEAANEWDDYNARPLPTPGETVDDKEIIWLRDIVFRYNIRSILDVGGNDGYFAFAVENPHLRVCSIDRARNAITKGFQHAKKHNSRVVFYVIDVANAPTNHRRRLTKEEVNWKDKLEAECVIVSSVMHHLCHQGKGLAWQIELYEKLARNYLLFEYIDKKDPNVRDWPQTWSREQFFNIMQENWNLIGSLEGHARAPGSKPHRKWYAFERKVPKPFKLGVEEFKEWHSAKFTKESAN